MTARTVHWTVISKLTHTLIAGHLSYVLKYANKTNIFAVSACLFVNLTVKSYKASALLVNVTTCTSVNVGLFRRVREYYDARGFVLLNGSDSTTHRAVLPKHVHSYSTETSANIFHWISYFLIFKPTELLQCQNNHTAYQTEQVKHTHTQYFSLQCSHSCYIFCFCSSCSIRCIILMGCRKI